jgi:hypothetical protein
MRFIQKVTLLFGIIFVGVAILGFLTGGMSMDAHMATSQKLVGLFPMNAAHNAVHLVFGVWALAASRSAMSSRKYCLLSGAIYLVLAGLGFILPEAFGLVPIGGNDIALHAVLGIALTAVGAMTGADEERVASEARA